MRHYIASEVGPSNSLLNDRDNPDRTTYLARFANREGRVFLQRFWVTYKGHRPEAVVAKALPRARQSPDSLAAVYRFIWPEADVALFTTWLTDHVADGSPDGVQATTLYDRYAPSQYALADRAHLVGLHPLELWLIAYLAHHPDATLDEIYRESAEARQESYGWLFNTRAKGGQDRRIRTILEVDAFEKLHRGWARFGYPFDSLVPSYATAIGSSGDTPAALAELMGIILNDGIRLPTVRIEELRFAEGTPYDRRFVPERATGVRVLESAAAVALRQQLKDVVEHGTGRRARDAVVLSSGTRLAVGGKTGTGDNRFEFGSKTSKGGSWIRNRTAAFVFFIGDRFYGTVTAHVPGREAGEYGFTSALPVQLFTQIVPAVLPMLEHTRNGCTAAENSCSQETRRGGFSVGTGVARPRPVRKQDRVVTPCEIDPRSRSPIIQSCTEQGGASVQHGWSTGGVHDMTASVAMGRARAPATSQARASYEGLERFSNRPCTPWGGRGTSARTDAGGLMRASLMDLRERVLLDSDAGMKAADVAAKYRVSGSWVRLLKQRRRETGAVAPRVQRQGRRGMLEPHLHTVADLIAAHPDRTLAELKDALATPARVPTVWRAVRALGLTVKTNGPPVRTRSA